MRRRSFLKGLIATPAVITMPSLLMPVKPRMIEADEYVFADQIKRWRLIGRDPHRCVSRFAADVFNSYKSIAVGEVREIPDRYLVDNDPAFAQFRAALAG